MKICITDTYLCATFRITNTFSPTGGVIIPISSSFTTSTPNQTRSICWASSTGRNTGSVTSIAPNGSMKVPSAR